MDFDEKDRELIYLRAINAELMARYKSQRDGVSNQHTYCHNCFERMNQIERRSKSPIIVMFEGIVYGFIVLIIIGFVLIIVLIAAYIFQLN